MGTNVMQKNLVYHKSAKGAEAIATRQHGLSPKLRSVLILVDGKRGVDELIRLSQALGDTNDLLGQLLDQGFIEPGGPAAPSTLAPASAPAPLTGAAPLAGSAPLPDAAPAMTLSQAQRFVVRRLTDMLGPNADDLCMRIEAARNVHDFQVAVAKAEAMLRQYVSRQTAADFGAEVRSHMPAN